MPVIYDNQEVRPVQTINVANTYQNLGDGRRIGNTITATVHGTIVATKVGDVETPINIENRLSTILQKQKQIRSIFANDGRWFEVQGWDGTPPTKFVAIVDSIEFGEGPWIETCPYSVTLHGETEAGEEPIENNHIESANESWQFEEGEGPHTYRATHNVQAKGKHV